MIVNDIDRDEDYLLTFSDTQSEIVVPVFDTDGKTVKGTIDVESEQENAFGKEDAAFLEECAIVNSIALEQITTINKLKNKYNGKIKFRRHNRKRCNP